MKIVINFFHVAFLIKVIREFLIVAQVDDMERAVKFEIYFYLFYPRS